MLIRILTRRYSMMVTASTHSTSINSRTTRKSARLEGITGGNDISELKVKNEDSNEAQKSRFQSKSTPKKRTSSEKTNITSPKKIKTFKPPTPPLDWLDTYEMIKKMREQYRAPVDDMGCERLAQKDLTPRIQRFQTLIALMLSSQTKDTINAVAMANLQRDLPGGLSLESILNVDPTQLNELIRMVGFHNIKTKNIKKVAEILRDRFEGDIPQTIDDLCSLPGVGPKMSYLCMQVAWGKNVGIGVDTHVHRISQRLGFTKDAKEPEVTRLQLEYWLPKEYWRDINPLLVGFGQTICEPTRPKCDICLLQSTCPSSSIRKNKGGKSKSRTEKKTPENGIAEIEDLLG